MSNFLTRLSTDERSRLMSGFWSSETLLQRLPSLIHPFDDSRIKHCAYELSLGSEAHITGTSGSVGENRLTTNIQDERVVIPPGQFALLLTEERVCVPDDALGLISIRSGSKLRGLVNVSGFHVDPGYTGRLVFAVFNAASAEIIISRGENMFLLWYCHLDVPTGDVYGGEYQHRVRILDKEIMNLQGPTYNPTALASRVRVMEDFDLTAIVSRISSLEDWRSSRRRWREAWQRLSLSVVNKVVLIIIGLVVSFILGASLL